MTSPRTSELEVSASLLRTKISFVRPIAAIVLRVTLPDIRDATTVLTGELRSSTGHVAALKLVGVIATVVLLIAPEVQRNATAGFTLEFV